MWGNVGLFLKKGRYDLTYKAQQLGARTSKAIRMFGIEDNQGNIVNDHQWALGIWKKYIQDWHDSENRPKDIAIEAEDKLDEDDKGPIILKSEVIKAIKNMRRKKALGDNNIPVDLLKELGDSGLKIMTALVNKIYMSGDWPKDLLDITMIALPKKNQAKDVANTEQLVSFHTLERLLQYPN